MPYAHVDRTDTFITDCEKLRPFSQAEAAGLLAAMRMLDGQEPNTMSYMTVAASYTTVAAVPPTSSEVVLVYASTTIMEAVPPASGEVILIYASNIPGTALGITFRMVGGRVQVLGCQRR